MKISALQNRLPTARRFCDQLSASYRRLGMSDDATRASRCWSTVKGITCECGVIQEAVPFYDCGSRLCPICGKRKEDGEVGKLIQGLELLSQTAGGLSPKIGLLTIAPSYRPDSLITSNVANIKDMLEKMQKKIPYFRNCLGTYSRIEFSPSRDVREVCKPHVHIAIMEASYQTNQKGLEGQVNRFWEGEGNIVNVDYREISEKGFYTRDRSTLERYIHTLRYVNKYSWFDAETLYPDQVLDNMVKNYTALKGVKLCDRRGEFRGLSQLVKEANEAAQHEAEEIADNERESAHYDDPDFWCCSRCNTPLTVRTYAWNGMHYSLIKE